MDEFLLAFCWALELRQLIRSEQIELRNCERPDVQCAAAPESTPARNPSAHTRMHAGLASIGTPPHA